MNNNENPNLTNNTQTNVNSVPMPEVTNVPNVVSPTGVNNTTPNVVNGATPNVTQVTPVANEEVKNISSAMQPVIDGSLINTANTSGPRIENTAVVEDKKEVKAPIKKDPNAMVNEKLKTVETNYKPPSKFKTFLLIVFFVLLLAFIIFLPEIEEYVEGLKMGNTEITTQEITSGRMICSLTSNTSTLDIDTERTFRFIDNQLTGVTLRNITRGDVTADATDLDETNNQCLNVKNAVGDLSGITISCEQTEGVVIVSEVFDLDSYDAEKVSAAYAEAGAEMLEYHKGDDIDTIRTNMLQAGFTCEKSE